jgi:hypothetical protein
VIGYPYCGNPIDSWSRKGFIQAAHQLDWSPSGRRSANQMLVAAFLALCRVAGPDR